MESVSAYRGFLALLRPLRPTRPTGALGHEHYMLPENALHAAVLRKYVASDDVSLGKVLGALEDKLGETLSEESRAPFEETMSHGNGISHQDADFVESYLYSAILHEVPTRVKRFTDYSEVERRGLPAALVGWVDEVSNRVLLLEGLIGKVARKRDWGEGYRVQTPTDPAYAGEAIFLAAHNPDSSDYRYAQEYMRERDERYFRSLDNVKKHIDTQPEPFVEPRPKATERAIDKLYGSLA